jgi:hypothetical protein
MTHVSLLLGPGAPTAVLPLWPVLEIVWVWLPWAAVCAWGLLPAVGSSVSGGKPRTRLGLRAASLGACAVSGHYLVVFRWPYLSEGWDGERLRAEFAAFLSSTWAGAPWPALAYAVGWTATASLLARVVLDAGAEWAVRWPAARAAALGSAGLFFVIGSSVVLRYATGSAWPLP